MKELKPTVTPQDGSRDPLSSVPGNSAAVAMRQYPIEAEGGVPGSSGG